jgi:NADPH-dependent 2,4-dienoyl-CoA reductase/sulfur reductase-like enzyme/Fe-S-cluster-containing hydrogenase component 2
MAAGITGFSLHRRDDAPQGLFCANGQCSHCTLIIDGYPLKSCITPLRAGMKVRRLIHVPELPNDDKPKGTTEEKRLKCDVLVIGGGPSGLTATIELAKLGLSIILVDDKDQLGGKLLLQTHKFFGSIEDCYAGTRGIDIAKLLDKEVRTYENVRVMTNATVAGVYKDRKAGIFVDNANYVLVDFQGVIVSSGARERSIVFPGNDMPGVYGAGAFQTLVNRDLVRSSKKVFIVGSGNVGLIAAYHALQAGINVAGIVDILDRPSGYKVHADKIKRMGVPVYLKHTVLCAEGDGKVERVTIAEVNDSFQPVLETARTFEVDTLLIAVGLSPIDEMYGLLDKYGFNVVKAGDADEIAEASSAMFGGRMAGIEMANRLGHNVPVDPGWDAKAEVLKSRPGEVYPKKPVTLTGSFTPVLHCTEEIPCNPCASACPSGGIKLGDRLGSIMDLPVFTGDCTACKLCVAICPGLAITMAKINGDGTAEVILPYEFDPDFETGGNVTLMDQEGNVLGSAEVLDVKRNRKHKTNLVHVKTVEKHAALAAGIRVQDPAIIAPLPEASYTYLPDDGVVCHCELVTIREVIDYIKEHDVRDVNQLKQIRVGMGACGGKNCSVVLPRIFREAGVDWNTVAKGTIRPLSVEIPMQAVINEEGAA